MSKNKYTFVDLFAGIGGFHQALHSVGGHCVYASEWDKNARLSYEANYKNIAPNLFENNHKYFNSDINDAKPEDIPDFDICCGGFPCQAFSIAGLKRGFEDTRGTLFFNIANIVRYKKEHGYKPKVQKEADKYLRDNFQDVLGKIYAPYDKEKTNCLSLALDVDEKFSEANDTLRGKLEQYFYIEEITKEMTLDCDPETLFDENRQTKEASTTVLTDEEQYKRVLVVVDINSKWDELDKIEGIYISMDVVEKTFEYFHEFANIDYILLTHRDERTYLFKPNGAPTMKPEKPASTFGRSFNKFSKGENSPQAPRLHMVFPVTSADMVNDYEFDMARINNTGLVSEDGKRDFYSPRVVRLAEVVKAKEQSIMIK